MVYCLRGIPSHKVKAIQWKEVNVPQTLKFLSSMGDYIYLEFDPEGKPTLSLGVPCGIGVCRINKGDYLVKGIRPSFPQQIDIYAEDDFNALFKKL